MLGARADLKDAENGRHLLQVARSSLIAFVKRGRPYRPRLGDLPEPLRKPASTFVTVRNGNRLRNCIGSTAFKFPLAVDVANNAAAAAHAPRFLRVTTSELAEVRLEVSILQVPRPLVYQSLDELLGRLRPHVDGVMASWKERWALLLPQTWAR